MDRVGRGAELRAQLHLKLLERFGSGPELADFLNSEAGRRFLVSFAGDRRSVAGRRILHAVQAGIGLVTLGAGLFTASWLAHEPPLGVAGALVLTFGIGFLLAAAASHRLSKRLGLETDGDS